MPKENRAEFVWQILNNHLDETPSQDEAIKSLQKIILMMAVDENCAADFEEIAAKGFGENRH